MVYEVGDTFTIDKNTTLYAVWEKKESQADYADYIVRWLDKETNQSIKSEETRKGTVGTVVSVTEADKKVEGYTYQQEESTESDTLKVSGTVLTLYFTKDKEPPLPETYYTVTYTDGVPGETVFPDQGYEGLKAGDATPEFVGTPTREGYTFKGWHPEVADYVTKTVTYTAQWETNQNTEKVTLSYDGNGATGTLPESQTVDKGSQVPIADKGDLEKEDCTFKEWNTKSDGTGTGYNPKSSIVLNENTTLYAIWEENSNPTDPTDPTDPTTPTNPTDPTTPSQPTNPTNPTDPTNPSQPTNPTNPTDPTTPIQPTDPTNPTDPTDPTTPSEPTDPTDPTNPTTPSQPTDPATPTEPTDPQDPTEPTTPVIPVGPTTPTDPGSPSDPNTPNTPADPNGPAGTAGGTATVANVPTVTPAAIPAVAALAPAAAAAPAAGTTVADDAVPLAAQTEAQQDLEQLADDGVPLAKGSGAWALLNFALMNLAIFECLMLLIGYFIKTKGAAEEEEEENKKLKKKGVMRIISLPIAAISIIAFCLTEDITLPTAIVDRYTLLMAIIALVQTVAVVLSRKELKDETDDETEEKAVA